MATEPMATEDGKTPQAERSSTPGEPPVPETSTQDSPETGPESRTDSATGNMAENVDSAVVQCANLFLNVRRLLFMSLGALALTAEEARDFVERLGERGDIAPGSSPELVQEELERWVDDLHHQHPAQAADGDGYRSAARRVDALWGRLRVPTRREIETLSRKISALDQKLVALRATRAASSPASTSSTSASTSAGGLATPPEL